MPTLTIDGKKVEAREGEFVLDVARRAGIEIPTLCYHPAVESWGGCRLCVVDVTRDSWDGWCKMVVSCLFPVEDGLIVYTQSERVKETRKVVLDLLLARCPETPLVQKLAKKHGIEKTSFAPNPEHTDCILCGLCTRVCDHLGMAAISMADRGAGRVVAPPFHAAPPDCIGCLACAEVCPTDHIKFASSDVTRRIWNKDFEMLRCMECGRAHISQAEGEYFAKKSKVSPEYFDTCDACKRKKARPLPRASRKGESDGSHLSRHD